MEASKQNIIEFLCGAGTYDGYWWGDKPNDKRPSFWWRSKLRDHVEALQSRVSELERENERLGKIILEEPFQKIERLEKEVETLREVLGDAFENIKQYGSLPSQTEERIKKVLTPEHLNKQSPGE